MAGHIKNINGHLINGHLDLKLKINKAFNIKSYSILSKRLNKKIKLIKY